MSLPQNSPEERINPELEEGQRETRRVSVLVNFELLPGTDISHWNSQLRLDDRAASGMFWGFLDKMLELGWASAVEPAVVGTDDPEEQLIEVNAADSLKIHEQDGHIGVYERFPSGDLTLDKEFPDRAAAEAYIDGIRQMGEASNQIGEDYSVMVRKWITAKAAETGLERRLVREFIGGIID